MGRQILLPSNHIDYEKEKSEGFIAYLFSSLLLVAFETVSLVAIHLFSL